MTEGERCDREAIRDLMARYTINGDRGRIEALAETFAEHGTLAFSGAVSTGRATIAARLGAARERNPALTVSRHHLATSLVHFDGERATARTYFQVLTNIGVDHHGHYADELAKIDGAWLFVNRDVRIDWQSPLSLYPPLRVRGSVVGKG